MFNEDLDIYKYFKDIVAIPHGSKNEEKLCDYLEDFAKKRHLKYKRDDLHDIIIYKDGMNGLENASPIMLQGHIDMVNEKNNDSHHDFDNDGLDLYIEDGYLKARGTTLGADDGVAVCYMLAILNNNNLKHPPLECVFTVQEEIGLIGAKNIKAEDITAKRMIGLDSCDENKVTISSSGGRRAVISKQLSLESNTKATYSLTVDGLKGGHSGEMIDQELGNANKLAIRVMYEMRMEHIDLHLVTIKGGLKENAICRECVITFASQTNEDLILEVVKKCQADFSLEFQFSDSNVQVSLQKINTAYNAIDENLSEMIINMIYIMPDGFLHKSLAIKGLTTVSLNLGVIRLDNNELNIIYSLRSPMVSKKEEMAHQLEIIANMFDANYQNVNDYPGWSYDDQSILRQQLINYVKETEGITLLSEATHGGLETGIFKGLIPELDIVTMGPNMFDIHTPKEKLDLESFTKCYYRLTGFLQNLI